MRADAERTYRPLDDAGLRDVLGGVTAVSGLLGASPAAWRVREVGDGNLNLVFIVEGEAGRGVVAKQALPYVRLVGKSWPLPLDRSHFEHMALLEQAIHVPHLVPAVHHYNRDLALIVMEYLQPHVIMRKGLIRGTEYPRFAPDIAEFLARTLFATSALGASAADHKRRLAAFAPNVAMCRITEDLVFTDPYRDAPMNRWTRPHLDDMADAFRRDAPLRRAAQERKHQFITCAEALIHGDLHTGSIMAAPASTPGSIRVIDPEFAFVGPMGFDIGAVLGNLLLAAFAQSGHEAAPGARGPYRAWILGQVEEVWRRFEALFLDLWQAGGAGEVLSPALFEAPEDRAALASAQARFMRGLFEDALAFAGCKMIRRILGLAHVEDLEAIPDPARRAASERRALILARELVLAPAGFSGIVDVTTAARTIEAG